MADPYLSEHLSWREMTTTGHASLQGLNRSSAIPFQISLRALCVDLLEPIRAHFGKPITINSGYRCLALNTAIKGSKTSQHMKGEAADFVIVGVDLYEIFEWLKTSKLPVDQAILEGHSPSHPTWIHASRSSKPRGEFLIFDGKNYHSSPG